MLGIGTLGDTAEERLCPYVVSQSRLPLMDDSRVCLSETISSLRGSRSQQTHKLARASRIEFIRKVSVKNALRLSQPCSSDVSGGFLTTVYSLAYSTNAIGYSISLQPNVRAFSCAFII